VAQLFVTSRKVAGSIPDGVIWTFHWRNPSGRAMTLGSTQPLTEMSTKDISWGVKAAGSWGWETYHLYVPIVYKFWETQPLETLRACPGIVLPHHYCL
jgi:hypothetical protein